MQDSCIEEILFKFKDREVTVIPCSDSWEQYGCIRGQLFDPVFLDRLWELLEEFNLVD